MHCLAWHHADKLPSPLWLGVGLGLQLSWQAAGVLSAGFILASGLPNMHKAVNACSCSKLTSCRCLRTRRLSG